MSFSRQVRAPGSKGEKRQAVLPAISLWIETLFTGCFPMRTGIFIFSCLVTDVSIKSRSQSGTKGKLNTHLLS